MGGDVSKRYVEERKWSWGKMWDFVGVVLKFTWIQSPLVANHPYGYKITTVLPWLISLQLKDQSRYIKLKVHGLV